MNEVPMTTLQAIFQSARRFGLSEEEAWRALDETLLVVGGDATVSEYLDELAATLARRIIVSERDASQIADRAKARRTG
jgi:hypothetical protein